jgi:hypothetical protein
MAVLRSESKATAWIASSLRAGPGAARFLGSSRAGCSLRSSIAFMRRGLRVAQGRWSSPSARAVSGFLASFMGPGRARAHQSRFVGGAKVHSPLVGSGACVAPGVGFWSNCVVKWTCGDMLRSNRPLLAAGHLPRR